MIHADQHRFGLFSRLRKDGNYVDLNMERRGKFGVKSIETLMLVVDGGLDEMPAAQMEEHVLRPLIKSEIPGCGEE